MNILLIIEIVIYVILKLRATRVTMPYSTKIVHKIGMVYVIKHAKRIFANYFIFALLFQIVSGPQRRNAIESKKVREREAIMNEVNQRKRIGLVA